MRVILDEDGGLAAAHGRKSDVILDNKLNDDGTCGFLRAKRACCTL